LAAAAFAGVLGASFGGPCARAADVVVADPQAYEMLLPTVTLNGQRVADGTLMLRRDNVYYARAADLVSWRLRVPAGDAIVFDGERFVSLASLGIKDVAYDAKLQTLAATVPAADYVRSDISFLSDGGAGSTQYSPTRRGFVTDYSLIAAAGSGDSTFADLSLTNEAFLLGGELQNGFVLATDGSSRFTRLDTDFIQDRPGALAALRFGDSYAKNDEFGAPLRFGGIQYGTSFDIDPRFVAYPTAAVRGTAYVPSVVDVYVNGLLTSSQSVQPGDFTLRNLALQGAGTAEVVVRDATGQTHVISQDFLSSPLLLKAHLSDYSVGLGFARINAGAQDDHYAQGMLTANDRYGLSDRMTLESHFEAGGGGAETSVALLDGVPRIGILGAGVSLADGAGGGGTALLGTYSVQRGPFTVDLQVVDRSANYQQVGDRVSVYDDRLEGTSFTGDASVRVGRRSSVTLSDSVQHAALSGRQSIAAATFRTALHGAYVSARLQQTSFEGSRSNGVEIDADFALGNRQQLSSSTESETGSTTSVLTYDRDTISGRSGQNREAQLIDTNGEAPQVSYIVQAPLQPLDLTYGFTAGTSATALEGQIQGALLHTKGATAATPTLGDTILVVETGLPNIRVRIDGFDAGRTDRNGVLATSQILVGADNEIELDPNDVPNATTARTTRHFTPPHRGTVVVDMTDLNAGAVSLHLYDTSGKPLPAGSVATASGDRQWPIGHDGLLYVAPAKPGPLEIDVDLGYGEKCAAHVVVPADVADAPDIGIVTCAPGANVSATNQAAGR
jgi:outer membrane usher protein